MLYVYVGLSELSLCAQEAMQCPTRHPVHLLHVHSDPPSGFRELVASLSLCPPQLTCSKARFTQLVREAAVMFVLCWGQLPA